MAHYRIMYWKDFPAQVQARDANGKVSAPLPDRFQQAIDAAAMVEDSVDTDAYLDGWEWGPEEERDGDAQSVALLVAEELDQEYPQRRLAEMIRSRKEKD